MDKKEHRNLQQKVPQTKREEVKNCYLLLMVKQINLLQRNIFQSSHPILIQMLSDFNLKRKFSGKAEVGNEKPIRDHIKKEIQFLLHRFHVVLARSTSLHRNSLKSLFVVLPKSC